MADDVDQANDVSALLLADAIAKKKKTVEAEATGECLNCSTKVAAGRRWCNAECRDEYERDENADS